MLGICNKYNIYVSTYNKNTYDIKPIIRLIVSRRLRNLHRYNVKICSEFHKLNDIIQMIYFNFAFIYIKWPFAVSQFASQLLQQTFRKKLIKDYLSALSKPSVTHKTITHSIFTPVDHVVTYSH